MSKRYGRNQKRKAREEIACLQSDLRSKSNTALFLERAVGEYRYWESRLNDVLPKYSALRKNAPRIYRKEDPGAVLEIESFVALNFEEVSKYGYSGVEMAVDRLRMNVMRVKANPDVFTNGWRVQLQIGSDSKHSLAYAIDDTTLAADPISGEQINWIAASIAHQMADYVQYR